MFRAQDWIGDVSWLRSVMSHRVTLWIVTLWIEPVTGERVIVVYEGLQSELLQTAAKNEGDLED